MIVAVDLSDLNTLTPELCKQLEQLLPLESRELLATPERLSSQDIRTIQAQLGHLWNGLSAMVPRWIVERIDTPAATAGRAAEATLLFADVTGFTPLTAQLEAFGRAGNEYLIDALNRFFAAIVPFALARGGDLLAFGGMRSWSRSRAPAMPLRLWPPPGKCSRRSPRWISATWAYLTRRGCR